MKRTKDIKTNRYFFYDEKLAVYINGLRTVGRNNRKKGENIVLHPAHLPKELFHQLNPNLTQDKIRLARAFGILP